jgi:hypothetical protein
LAPHLLFQAIIVGYASARADIIRSISTTSKRSNLTSLRGLAAHEFTGAPGKLKRS